MIRNRQVRTSLAYSTLFVVLATASAFAWGQAANSKDAREKPAAAPSTDASSTPPAAPKGDRATKPSKGDKSVRTQKELPGFTAEREAAALLFVRTHHPELADLLEQLKVAHATQYQQAIRDLFRTSEKLAQTQERNPRRYDLDLQAWKLQSRVQVLAARLAMGPNPAIETELRAALMEQQKVQMDQLVEERERLASRIKELDVQIETLRTEQNQRVDARLEDLLKGIRKSSLKFKKGGEKNGDAKNGDGKNGDGGKNGPGAGAKPAAPASTVVKSDTGR
jgi:hypothetical protein